MLSEIRDRKLVQWVIAYVAGAFIVLQGLAAVKEGWPEFAGVLRVAFVLALIGLPVVIVIGWFHGEQGRQRVTIPELILIAAVILVGGLLTVRLDVYDTDVETYTLTGTDARLDSSRYAVLPFRGDAGVPESLNGALRIHDALDRWRGIDLVDYFQVVESLAADSTDTRPRRDQTVAAAQGAGRYVTGSLSRVGSDVRVRVSLHDTRTGERLADTVAHVPPGGSLEETTAQRIADHLLFRGEVAGGGPFGTSSLEAGRAFVRAQRALRQWELAVADSLFGVSLRADPEYARALLWRAQVRTWAGQDPGLTQGLVERALARRDRLPEPEEQMAEGLLHLARDEYREACASYTALRAMDERDFAAWFGLGECRSRDGVVIRDPTSPSGWSFRSSYHQAALAYRRAFELLPVVYEGLGSQTFEQIGGWLKVSTDNLRRGYALPPDTVHVLARPALIADTLAFIPYPRDDFSAGRPGTRPATYRAAVEHQRRLYNEIATEWAQQFPGDPDALRALAHTRELLGHAAALETLAEARRLTEDPHRKLMMAADQVKLMVKFGSHNYAGARTLADSVLSNVTPRTADELKRVAVVAALVGRPHRAARWALEGAAPREWDVDIPVAVTGPASALLAYAALGAPADSIAAYERRARAALSSRVPPEDQAAAAAALLLRAAALAYPVRPLQGFEQLAERSGFLVLQAQAAHAQGDATAALTILDEAVTRRRENEIRATEVSFDVLFPEAWLWAELGDTAQAVVMLDQTLNTLRWTEPGILGDIPRAAGLVRAMALRAELAAGTGEPATAQRWAKAVADLWADADDALQPLVRRMREIARNEGGGLAPRSDPY